MIKIGDFARLCQISIVTLRHYDELGLLKPISIDSFTGYRYYSADQLPRINRILALKDLGFSLNQIDAVLKGDLSLEQLRGMLKMKQAEAEQRLIEEQGRLFRIAARLKQIELEDSMPNYDVILKTTPATLIASRRITIPTNDQVPDYLGPAIDEVYGYLKMQGARDTAPCLAIWHQPAEILVNEEAEAAVPIDRAVADSDRVKSYVLPSTLVASAILHGDYAGFAQIHAALLTWIEANGYVSLGNYREIYIKFDAENTDNHITEVQYPVIKAQ